MKNLEEQRVQAESALASLCATHLADGPSITAGQKSLPKSLQGRYELLMSFVVNPNWPLTALENLAAARELIDTAWQLGAIDERAWRAYVVETNLAKSHVTGVQIQRATDARSRGHSGADENGVRPAIAEDGAYRFNPLTGHHE